MTITDLARDMLRNRREAEDHEAEGYELGAVLAAAEAAMDEDEILRRLAAL